MNAYFNELSFTHYADRAGAKTGLLELIECLKRLDEFSIKNIKRSQQTDKKCLVGNESYLRMLNDETLIDKDMKSVLINRMETLEPEDELVDKYLVVSMKHNSQDCKGLGWASPESDTREKLFASRMTFLFENGISYLCSWHLRFTPGAGRIHFYHEPTEKKIYIGYIGAKIQAE